MALNYAWNNLVKLRSDIRYLHSRDDGILDFDPEQPPSSGARSSDAPGSSILETVGVSGGVLTVRISAFY
ncbi:hypothetical protein JCM3770_005786 [Rhodotorula araucariae]